MGGNYYPARQEFDVVGSNSSGTRTYATLVDYYNLDGATTKTFESAGFIKLDLDVSYKAGVGETLNSIQIAVDGSQDGTNWYRFVNDSTADGTSTLTAREFTFAQSLTDGTLAYDAQSGNFTAGLKVTDGTTSATAWVESDTDDGTTGTLLLSNIAVGVFGNDNAITDSGSGAATINGILASITDFTVPLDISTKHIRVSVKESGVSSAAGTVYIAGMLSGK